MLRANLTTEVADWLPSRDEGSVSSESELSNSAEIDLEEESDESIDSEEAAERWHAIRKPVQPQPDQFKDDEDFYTPKESARLSERFKSSGLQIIVKVASIELTPQKQDFPLGGWHVSYQ